MDDLDLELEGLSEVLADPDLYVLMLRGEVEATFTQAELRDLLSGARQLRAEENKRRRSRPRGLAGAFQRALSGPASDIDALLLKLQPVTGRAAERAGYGPLRQAVRDILRPDDQA